MKGTQCTAKSKRSGLQCRRLVVGGGVCRMHGGANPVVNANRLQRIAIAQAAAHLPERDTVTGEEALVEELSRTVVEVRELERFLAGEQYDDSRLQGRYLATRGHLKQVAEACVRLDVTGKQQALNGRQGALIVLLLRRVIAGLGLDPGDPHIGALVRDELLTVQRMDQELTGAQLEEESARALRTGQPS